MSATEIIEQIKKLPVQERQKIVEFVHSVESVGQPGGTGVSREFKEAADKMFTTNAELFRKLAQ